MHHAASVVSALLFTSCAVSTDGYLKSIRVTLPTTGYSDITDTFMPGKATKAETDGPFPSDFPPSRTITLEDPRPYPSFDRPRYAFRAMNVLRFYDLRGVDDQRTISGYVERLKNALSKRQSARELEDSLVSLPDFPPRNAAHLVQDRVSYHEFSWGRGLFYLVEFTQGPGNYPNNEELIYLFQGISNDEKFYVSGDFRVTHPILPATIDSIPDYENIDDRAQAAARALDRQPDATFQPDLKVIRDWVASISTGQGEPVVRRTPSREITHSRR